MTRIGEVLKAWREKRDLTVRDVAPLLAVSPSTLSRIERGAPMDGETQLRLIVFLFTARGTDDAPPHGDDPRSV